jgi:hypothetical protein
MRIDRDAIGYIDRNEHSFYTTDPMSGKRANVGSVGKTENIPTCRPMRASTELAANLLRSGFVFLLYQC